MSADRVGFEPLADVGDLGVETEDGAYLYAARLDDALRVRGFLVTPRDIEAILDEHDDVELSQVVGTPHPRHGEVPIAFVERTETDLTADALYDHLDEHVADYKIPTAIEFVDEFPRTEGPNGQKIQKNVLRDCVADWYENE